MSDIISRQAAITLPVMPKEHREYQTYNLDDAYEQGWLDLQKCIEKLPSAQLEIIRCKDCKYGSPNGVYGCRLERYNFNDESVRMYGEDFCSYGERRTETDALN